MEASTWFVFMVFGLGSVVGGLFVTLQRQCEMERIKRDFELQLTALLESRDSALMSRNNLACETEYPVSQATAGSEEPGQDEGADWEHLLIPPPENSTIGTHVGI